MVRQHIFRTSLYKEIQSGKIGIGNDKASGLNHQIL